LAGLCLAEPVDEGYSPVASAPALDAALRSQLKTVRDWVNDQDFVSAGRDAQGLAVLAHLYAHQGGERGWRERTTALANAATRLAAAARGKDADACGKQMEECTRLLDDLAKRSPGAPALVKDFKPHGGTTTWMLLMDAAYSDAKTARSAGELERLAGAIAEESNALRYVRAEARWRQTSREVQTAALNVAQRAKAGDLAGAKTALKLVYRRCEACHDQTRRR
jgi:cytochrome c556